MKKAIATPVGEPTKHVNMKQAEVIARAAEEAASIAAQAEEAPILARKAEYEAKGWITAFDLVEDMLDRGIDTIKSERAAIKAKHPKK